MEFWNKWFTWNSIELPEHLQGITQDQAYIGIIIGISIIVILMVTSNKNKILLGWDYLRYQIGVKLNLIYRKEEPEFVFKDEDPNSNLDEGLKAKDILDSLLESKFEFYMYKEILPLYLGNQKKAPVTNEKFKELKNTFYQDIKLSLSPVLVRRLNYIFTPSGIGVYIHAKFATMFNKTDSKFIDKNEVLDKDNFFMNGGVSQ